ncbi:hypothetical protein RE428_22210 [Marinobacter nanhaiticus D15-8W]|nr:hypothetical protein RE428_22210 [Marinobacter nanhaiticus D15-8W]
MELAEIEIYWSFAIHSSLTLSYCPAMKCQAGRMVGVVRCSSVDQNVEGGHGADETSSLALQPDMSPIPG